MFCDKNILLFGFSDFAEEILESICTKSILIIDNSEKNLQKAKSLGYNNTKLIDLEDEDILESLIKDKDFVFTLSEEEALNIFVVISIRSFCKNIEIISLGREENKNKFLLAGANRVIDPYEITANRIYDIIQRPLIANILDSIIFSNTDLEVAQVFIKDGCMYDGKYLDDCDFDKYELMVVGVIDTQISNNFLFATGHHRHILNGGDTVVIIGKDYNIKKLKLDLGL